MKLVLIILSAVLVNNFIWAKFLGLCPFIGVSKHLTTAAGMGMAVIFVMTLAALVSWPVQYYLLVPFHIDFLQTIFFILIIAALVQFLEIFINKTSPNLKRGLGIYLPLITTNCAVLGVALLNVRSHYSFAESVTNALGAGIGFMLALLLMAGIRERLELADVPPAMKGVPITFVVAAGFALAFAGFYGMLH